MTNREKAISLATTGLKELELEIDRHEKGVGTVGETAQLLGCKRFLTAILLQMQSDQIPEKSVRESGMSHMIVDSWPFDSEAG